MQSRTDAALRKVIQDKKAPVKVKRECLATMDSPSSAFLAEIVNGDYPPKLKVDAARRLAKIQEAKRHREEVDAILKQEIQRLAKRDPDKKTAIPPVPIPAPPVAQFPRPETGQAIAPKSTVAQSIPVQPIPKPDTPPESKPMIAPTQLPATVPNRIEEGERKPIFTLPRGAILERDEQNRLLDLFRIVADTSKSETGRGAARNQLERVIPMPDAARSMFAVYLLKMLEYLDRHPEERPKTPPPSEQNPEFELFRLNFSVSQWLRQQTETEKLRQQSERANRETADGGFWDKLPAI